jgi:glucose/arabinose dehydrogenase
MRVGRLASTVFFAACSAVLGEPTKRTVEKNPVVTPLSPAESMKHIRLAPGFRIELVASEPQIREPVALTWDGDGRMYVVEMRGYMQDIEATGAKEPVGRISRLEDTDGDGVMDRHTVYLDGLVEPRAVLAVDDGILVGEPSDLWFCRDTDGDGVADTQELVYEKFSLRDSNVEHKANSLCGESTTGSMSPNTAAAIRSSEANSATGASPLSGSGGWRAMTRGDLSFRRTATRR